MTTTIEHITIDGDRYIQVTVTDQVGLFEKKLFCTLSEAQNYCMMVATAWMRSS